MSDSDLLLQDYERLRDHTDPHRRGYDFQELVARILGGYHFKVERKSRANSRQVDLFATRGDEIYLIETKWRRDKADIADVASLYDRLDAVPTNVKGLLVSQSGFTSGALQRVREKSSRPVVLVSGAELERELHLPGGFLALLRRKASALLVHREVLVDKEGQRAGPRPAAASSPSDLPPSDRTFVLLDGSPQRWLRCGGSFSRFTFIPELPDIHWVSGGSLGVTLDMVLLRKELGEFVALLDELARMGWVTRKGCWSIQQLTATWHGFGADTLVEALHEWKRRYEGLKPHHTEELCYADTCDDGFYTLVAQVSADERRIVWRVDLSFQLRGIPLDTGPYRQLYEHFGLHDPVYFRPRSERSLTMQLPPRTSDLRDVTPLAYVVALETLGPDEADKLVTGIVVENPLFAEWDRLRRPLEWMPERVAASEYLVCDLRSWHELRKPKSVYELVYIESAQTSDALVVQVAADWRDEPDDAVPTSMKRMG